MLPFSIQLTLLIALPLATVLALLAGAWTLRTWRKQAECDAQRMFEQLDLVRAELMLLTDRVNNMPVAAPTVIRERAAPVEIKAPPITAAVSGPRGYEIAARLARGGATCDELISSCGLSRHEAELLMRLNKAEVSRAQPEAIRSKPASTTGNSSTGSSAAPTKGQPAKSDTAQPKAIEATRARLAAVV